MSRFLRLITVIEALNLISLIAPEVGEEMVPLTEAYDRVLAQDIRSDVDIPGFKRSVKDGFAVFSADALKATESRPVVLNPVAKVVMGRENPSISIEKGQCAYIPTGGAVPDGADAVIMLEYCQDLGNRILVNRPVSPGENIILADEDFADEEIVLTAGRKLKVQDIGVLAAVGSASVPVRKRPVIGIISTGIELVKPDQQPAPGEIRDVNSYLCGAFITRQGGIPRYLGIIRDNPEELKTLLKSAISECDAILITGGSSKDDRDITAGVIKSLGKVLAHGIALAPGKPTIIGQISEKPIIGVPGHPASTFVVLTVFITPLIHAMTQCTNWQKQAIKAVVRENIPSERGREEYVRVQLCGEEAIPIFGKSGLLNTLIRSDGIIRIAPGSEGIESWTDVEVSLW
jgi:molybdopterin molybdotransferase